MMNGFNNFNSPWMMPFGLGFLGILPFILFVAILVWSLVWKGMALWKAAREGSKNWFVALLVLNTAGILDILYLCVFSKKAKAVVHHHQSE